MVVVFAVGFAFLGVKQVITSHELENHAGETPDVRTLVVFTTQDYFGGSVFSSLDNVRVVLVNIARIAHITQFDADVAFLHLFDHVVA